MTKKNFSKEKRLPHCNWRLHRDGKRYPYATYSYKDSAGMYKRIEQICEPTLESIVDVREKLKRIAETKNNLQKFGLTTSSQTTTFKLFYSLWLQHKQNTVRAKTVNGYKRLADTHLLPALDKMYLNEIDEQKLSSIINKLIDSRKFRTAQITHRILSNMFDFAVKQELINKSPFSKTPYPKNRNPKNIEILTQDEAKKFLELCQQKKHGLLFKLALLTGMRPEEYLGLRWHDIDFNNNLIIVKTAVDLENSKEIVFHPLKTPNSYRSIPFSAKIAAELVLHKNTIVKKQTKYNLVFLMKMAAFRQKQSSYQAFQTINEEGEL